LLYDGTQDTSLLFHVLFRILEGINKKDMASHKKVPIKSTANNTVGYLKCFCFKRKKVQRNLEEQAEINGILVFGKKK